MDRTLFYISLLLFFVQVSGQDYGHGGFVGWANAPGIEKKFIYRYIVDGDQRSPLALSEYGTQEIYLTY